jgi:nitrite reductase/ring-hydroxylating ferredoxin subunit
MATEYKLKGLTSVDLKNGQKAEYEVEGIEGGKVLLVKAQDGLHAMSPNCTHYGAPLVGLSFISDGQTASDMFSHRSKVS